MQTNRNYYQQKSSKKRWFIIAFIVLLFVAIIIFVVWLFSRYTRSDPPSITSVKGASTQIEVKKNTVIETEMIPFGVKTVDDATKYVGSSTVITPGAYGVRTMTYEVTPGAAPGQEKKLISDEVTTAPVDKVVSIGTKKSGDPE
ncbi:MAG: G5 domain-containing protein [Candidatus Saccharibacteria bacterium]|nr:G5 domain-containing protein [Candidatus Saccharibacteria bacterium]